jgi:hypothetical protein
MDRKVSVAPTSLSATNGGPTIVPFFKAAPLALEINTLNCSKLFGKSKYSFFIQKKALFEFFKPYILT